MACIEDTDSVHLEVDSGTLSADVKISATVENGLSIESDGLFASGAVAPTGIIVGFGGAAAPSTWLLCDGSAVSRSTYAALFAVIGTAFGSGDGSTTFNVPDSRDRVEVGAGGNTALAANEGVLAANRHGTRHRHTPHVHTFTNTPAPANTSGGAGSASGNFNPGTTPAVVAADGGSGISTDPLDGSAYYAVTKIIKT